MDGPQLYLDYLEKEMNLMGILSAFCILTVGLTLKEIIESTNVNVNAMLRSPTNWYIIIGSSALAVAALLFYCERSCLAWYHGQISLAAKYAELTGKPLKEWLKDADSWKTWNCYHWAFPLLGIGLLEYFLALVQCVLAVGSFVSMLLRSGIAADANFSIFILAVLFIWRYVAIYSARPYEDSPFTFLRIFSS